VNITELMNETLPRALAGNAEALRKIGARYQLNIPGEGEWVIDVTSQGPSCRPGVDASADCTVTVSPQHFLALLDNPQSGMVLFSTGKLQIDGNQLLALELQRVFACIS
jgi:putative sterol carrier protein